MYPLPLGGTDTCRDAAGAAARPTLFALLRRLGGGWAGDERLRVLIQIIEDDNRSPPSQCRVLAFSHFISLFIYFDDDFCRSTGQD